MAASVRMWLVRETDEHYYYVQNFYKCHVPLQENMPVAAIPM